MTRGEIFSDARSAASKRWSVAFSAAFMNFVQTGAFFFTPTTLMPLVVLDFGLDLSISTVPISIGKIAYVLSLLPGGMLVDFYGPRKCVLAGILGLGITLGLYAALASRFSQVIIAHITLAMFSSVSGVPVYSLFVAQWFKGGMGLAMGLVLSGYSAAGTAVPALLGPVATEVGWRAAMGCVSFAVLVVGLPVAYMFLDENDDAVFDDYMDPAELSPILPDRACGDHPIYSGAGSVDESVPADNLPGVLTSLPHEIPQDSVVVEPRLNQSIDQSWTFMGFALNYMLLQYSFGALGENILFFLTLDRGFSLSFASLFFSILNLSAFTAKLVGGHLGDRFDRFRVAMATSALTGLGVLLLFWGGSLNERNVPRLTSSPLALVAFSITFGFGYGATFNCLYALVPIIFGLNNLGRTQSSLFGLGLVGNALGSIATGVLRSRYGTYDRAFLVAGITTWTNMIVFGVTKHFVGGSMEKLTEEAERTLQSEYEAQQDSLDETDRHRRGLALKHSGSFVGDGPTQASPGFFGAVFQTSPSTEHLLDFGSPSFEYAKIPPLPRLGSELHLGPAASSSCGDYSSQDEHDQDLGPSFEEQLDGRGVEFDSGFPYPRTWSSGSLRRIKENKRRRREPSQPLAQRGDIRETELRHSSTLENLLQSGIMSSSLEDIGYVGSSSSSMRRNSTTPNVLHLGLSRDSVSSQSHGHNDLSRSKSSFGSVRGLPPLRAVTGHRNPPAKEHENLRSS